MATQRGRILVGALDRIVCSSANYWAAMLSDLAAALVFLALGLNRFSGPWVAAGAVVIVGFMSLGLLEYVVHRWVLHGPPSMARRGHAQHHAEPRALISTPLFVIMTGALTIWGLLGLVLPAGVAGLLVFGLYAGYNYFALVHHWQHHRGKDLACVAYLRRLERLHHLHHHRQVVNFGISTTMWDRLFGTFQPTNGASDGLRLLEHDQIVLDETDLQAERDELRIERHLHPLAAFGGAQAREGCGLEDLSHSHLFAGPGPPRDSDLVRAPSLVNAPVRAADDCGETSIFAIPAMVRAVVSSTRMKSILSWV